MNALAWRKQKTCQYLTEILAEMRRSISATDPWIKHKDKLSPARERWRPPYPRESLQTILDWLKA
jgi:hypothetical protein